MGFLNALDHDVEIVIRSKRGAGARQEPW